jgi:hypothetical protein
MFEPQNTDMALKGKLKWSGAIENRRRALEEAKLDLPSSPNPEFSHACFIGTTFGYAVECYLEGDANKSLEAAKQVVGAALEYFYGGWRKVQPAPDGTVGHEAWKPFCLWYEQVTKSLPWACALSDWEAACRIAEYPPHDRLPEAARARGETAWGWALISFLRGGPRKRIEEFIAKAESDKAKRPKLLCPVLRALIENDAVVFEETLLAYLAYYRKSEFRLDVDKVLALDGTTLYHLGRKQGFKVQLPEDVFDHVIHLNAEPVYCQQGL